MLGEMEIGDSGSQLLCSLMCFLGFGGVEATGEAEEEGVGTYE